MSQARSFLQPSSQQEVHIYLRNSQKRAHFIKIKKQIEYDQIRRIISDKIKLPTQKLVLFLKGEQLSQHGKIILSEKNIVHLVNLDNVHREHINIHIKRLQGEKLITHFKVDSKSNIKEFIDTKLQEVFKHNSEEIFLVYTGKQLDISKNWEEEFVEDQSELLCVNLDQSETPICEPSSITHHSKKKVDKSATDIELGPGKTYTESFIKKPAQSGNNAAPGSQQEIPVAPPNVWKKTNIPVQSNPEDLKKPPNNTVPFQPKVETEHKLHSANRPQSEDNTQEERPILRSENPEPEGQSAANDAAHTEGLRLQLEKEISQESLERITQNIAVNAEASAPAVVEVAENPITLEAEDEAPKKVESQPQEEEVHNAEAVCQEHVEVVVQEKTEHCQPNEAATEEIPEKLESSPQETVNVQATAPATAAITETVEEKITLDAQDQVPKVQSHPQEEQEQHKISPTHHQPQIQLRSGHHEQKQVSHQVVVEQIPHKLQEVALNIAFNAIATDPVQPIAEVATDPIVLEAQEEVPKVESQPEQEAPHEETHVSQEEKVIEVEHHEIVEVKQTETVSNDKQNPQEIVYQAEDEAPKVQSAPEPQAPEETIETKLQSSPVVEQKLEAIPVHSEEKAEVHHQQPLHVVAANLIDQIKFKLNEKFHHEGEETKELKSQPQPILAEFNSANSLSSEVARGDLEGLVNGTTKHVQEVVAVGEETEPLAVALESAPTAQQEVVEETTSLHAGFHEELHKPEEEVKQIQPEVIEEKHADVAENAESHPEAVIEQETSEVHPLVLHAEAPEIIPQHHEEIHSEIQHKETTQEHEEILPVQNVHAHSVQHQQNHEQPAELHSPHKQPEVVVEAQVVEKVNVPTSLESAPVTEEVIEVPHIEQNNEKPAVLETTTKEAVVESEVPVAEDEAPPSALKSLPQAEHQPDHHQTHEQAPIHVEHEEKPVEVQSHPTIEHHEQVTEEIHNLHAVVQHQEPEHNDEVLHSHAPAIEEQTGQQVVQEVITEHIEPTKETHHETVADHQPEVHQQEVHQQTTHPEETHQQEGHQQEAHQQEAPATLESSPQKEEHSQIQKAEQNNETEHKEVAEHKEPEAIDHVEATFEVEQAPVHLQSAPAHYEQQIIAEPSHKHEEVETHVQTHHVPHIQAQLHTVEVQYQPEHKQLVDIVSEQQVQTNKEETVVQLHQGISQQVHEEIHEEIHEEVHENVQAVENPQIPKNEQHQNTTHIEHVIEVTHEPAHVQHEVTLHSAPEQHQNPQAETEAVEQEPVHHALESSPAVEETHHVEATVPIIVESKQQQAVVEPKETNEDKQEQPVEDDELPHSTISPNQTKQQAHIAHQPLQKPIEAHHVIATLDKIEPLTILHHAVDHQLHVTHAQELIASNHEVETSLPAVEQPIEEKVQEAQEEAAPALHSAPEETHEAIEELQHAQSKHSEVQHQQQQKQEVHAENEPEKLQENVEVAVLQTENHEDVQHEVTQPEHKVDSEPHHQVVAEHQTEESPEAHTESKQVETQAHPSETHKVEAQNLLFGAQHHIDLEGVDIDHVLLVGISATLKEEPIQEVNTHQEVDNVVDVEPVSAALESSPVNQEVHEESTKDKAVVDPAISNEEHIEEHIEIAQATVTDDDIPHVSLQSSPQEEQNQPDNHKLTEQVEIHSQEQVHPTDVPIKYDETPSVMKRTVTPHEANVHEQDLEHQHSDSLDEKPREVAENPQTPQVVIGHEPTFATSFPQQTHHEALLTAQHQEIASSTPAPAQVPSQTTDHLTQIDQFFNNNPIKLQTLNNPLQSELNPSNSRLSEQSQGEFEKISVPMQEHIEFKAGDLIYSGEMHLNETENLMQDILNDYSHLLAKSPQAFQETFGAHLK